MDGGGNGDARLLVCDCGGTMALDGERLGCEIGHELCRSQLQRFEAALEDAPLLVACTQEAPLFAEVAEAAGAPSPRFVNIRERAGWHDHEGDAHAKIAALIAEARVPAAQPPLMDVRSAGHVVVVGEGQETLDTAFRLSVRMPAVTLILREPSDLLLPSRIGFPIVTADRVRASGAIGSFTLTLDGFARLDPTSRRGPRFGEADRDAKLVTCDLLLDISEDAPLVTGGHKRDGYRRVRPGDAVSLLETERDLAELVGEFEKPIHVSYDPTICAHSRNRITGCTNCLDACPAGAIEPSGDGVRIDALICAGCGSCASHCPSGAVAYNAPTRDGIGARANAMLGTYLSEGGTAPVLLVHDTHGSAMIDALARLGPGLPPNVLPFDLPVHTLLGHDHVLAAAAAGTTEIIVLGDPRRADETVALQVELEVANAVLEGVGHRCRARLLTESDPDALLEALLDLPDHAVSPTHRHVAHSPDKRENARAALVALGAGEIEPFALPDGAPYGRIIVDQAACTLCMACVSACPAEAIRDNLDRPELRFVEANCLQCGICSRTCPENAITLEARLDPRPSAQAPVTLNEEEPARCTRCSKPFAASSTVERMVEKLSGHWMYAGERAELLRMCEQCRLETQAAGGRDPFAMGERPVPRTAESDAQKAPSVSDFIRD